MDIFDAPEYRLNKVFLSTIGQWPFVNPKVRLTTFVTITVISMTQLAAKFCCVFNSYLDTDLLFESIPPIIADMVAVVKIVTYTIKMNQIKILLNEMRTDWILLKAEEEVNILRKYAHDGKKYSQLYAGFLYSAMILFLGLPVAPRLLLRIGNMSEPRPLPHNVEYYVDHEEYYYPILLHSCLATSIFVTGLVAGDALFITFIQHACGICATIGYRLQHLQVIDSLEIDFHSSAKDYHDIRECIQRHIRLLSFVKTIRSLYNVAFLLQAALNMILISITGVRAVMVVNSPSEVLRYLAFSNAQFIHLCFESVQAQRLIDYSLKIRSSLMNTRWYLMSLRTRKLVYFMTMRSQVPCSITAGSLITISMEFCATVIRTSVSYFTILRTMQ